MNKHTPGPWHVDIDTREDMEWNNHICEANGDRICFMAHSNGREFEKDEANAELIAAAPMVKYEAENILAAVDRGETVDANHPYITSLRAALSPIGHSEQGKAND